MTIYNTDVHKAPYNVKLIVQKRNEPQDIEATLVFQSNNNKFVWLDNNNRQINDVWCWRYLNIDHPRRSIVKIIHSDKYKGRIGRIIKVELPLTKILLIPTLDQPESTMIELPPYKGDYEHIYDEKGNLI